MQSTNLLPKDIHLPHYYNPIDYLHTQSPVQTPNPATFIIDYGSFTTKAGCVDTDINPSLVCLSETFRTKRNNQDMSINGNDLLQEYYRINPKQVLEDFTSIEGKAFEDFNDYVLSTIKAKKGDRIIFTEPLGVVSKFRDLAFELFFECYDMAEIMPCVDSMAASYKTLHEYRADTGLIVSLGNKSTTMLPFIQHNLDTDKVRRLNIGMDTMKNTMTKLFTAKYTNFRGLYIPKIATKMFESEAMVAIDYKSQLRFYKSVEYDSNSDYVIALDEDSRSILHRPIAVRYFQSEEEKVKLAEEKRLQKERRADHAKKLSMLMEERRVQRKQAMQEELDNLEKLTDLIQSEENAMIVKQELEVLGYGSESDLKARIKALRLKLGLWQPDPDRFAILNIPDDQLSPRSLKTKRIQIMHKKGMEKRETKRKEREARENEIEKLKANPQKYLEGLLSQRSELKTKLKRIKQFKEDSNLRKTRDTKLMQNFDNYLDDGDKSTAEFDVALQELMDVSSDPEKYEEQLEQLHQEIKTIKPDFDEEFDNDEVFVFNKYNSTESVWIGTDLIRSTESLFRPYLIGNTQKGLTDSISQIVSSYNPSILPELLKNIYLVGGGANLNGLPARLQNDLFVRFNSKGVNEVVVRSVPEPIFAAYHGIRKFYSDYDKEYHKKLFYTKKEYEEYGSNLFKNIPIGNL